MAVCEWCQQEMTDKWVRGCDTFTYDDYPGLPPQARINYGQERHADPPPSPTCRDCGAWIGQPHHPGCCIEQCPVCLGQLISCQCPRPADNEAQ